MPLRIGMYHCKVPHPGRKPGGVEVVVHQLANVLAQRGHDVRVLTYSTPPPDAVYDVTRLRPAGAEERKVVRQYLAPWLFNVRSFDEFDVFHCHGDDWFWLRRDLPTVRTFYGSALNEARSATSWKRRLDQSLIFALEQVARSRATSTYAIGPDSQAIYGTDGLLGIGTDVPAEVSPRAGPPAILFIGTWEGRKRGRLLHHVFTEHVRARHPDAELWMVADRCEPAPGVTWYESPTDAELRGLLRRATIFCLPSSYEGFGIPYIEAMAHGVPVVATANPGAELVLDRGRYGRIVADDDLGATLSGLLDSPEERAALATLGRERAEAFAWPRIAEDYEAAYAEAISRWRDARRPNGTPRA
jgi:glycosyltransferase involved in cell wall biosynthesis